MDTLIVANWKNYLNADTTIELAKSLCEAKRNCDLVICPAFPYLHLVQNIIANSDIQLGAQNCASSMQEALTGEVNAKMLREAGCKFALVGHSERRQYLKEDAVDILNKIRCLLEYGITPILCIGESLDEYRSGNTQESIRGQLINIESYISNIMIAYEPIWAINTEKSATLDDILKIFKVIESIGKPIKILYGGSVNNNNFFALHQRINGFLIGRASAKLNSLLTILI